MEYQYNDGGRAKCGYKGDANDCVTRAIAIATGMSYQEVYDKLFELIKEYGSTKNDKVAKRISRGKGLRGTTPRNGISKEVYHPYLLSLGFNWIPLMEVGKGVSVHLNENELPKGVIIARVSKHVVVVIDHVLHDTFDCSRGGKRAVYGYYSKATDGI